MVQKLVTDRLVMQPREDENGRYYEFSGVGTILPVVSGTVPHNLESPTGIVASEWRSL